MMSSYIPLKSDLVVEQSVVENVLGILNSGDTMGQFSINTHMGYDGEWESVEAIGVNWSKQVVYTVISYNDVPIIICVADINVDGMDDYSLSTVKTVAFTQLISYITKHGIYNIVQNVRTGSPVVFRVNFNITNDDGNEFS